MNPIRKKKALLVLIPIAFLSLPVILLLGCNALVYRGIRKEEQSLQGNDRYRVQARFSEQKSSGSSPAVLLIHAFAGSPLDFEPLIRELENEGIAYHAVLLPGHGTSPRDLREKTSGDLLSAAEEAYDALEKQYGTVCVMGVSMGGAISLHLAEKKTPEKIVLYGPYVDITKKWYYFGSGEKWAKRLHKILPYVRKLKPGNINDPRGLEKYESYDYLPVKTVGELAKISRGVRKNIDNVRADVLWFHSPGDIASDYGSARELFSEIPGKKKRFVECPRSNHLILYDYDGPEAIEETISFIKGKERP